MLRHIFGGVQVPGFQVKLELGPGVLLAVGLVPCLFQIGMPS